MTLKRQIKLLLGFKLKKKKIKRLKKKRKSMERIVKNLNKTSRKKSQINIQKIENIGYNSKERQGKIHIHINSSEHIELMKLSKNSLPCVLKKIKECFWSKKLQLREEFYP
jgi:hypothetical protein